MLRHQMLRQAESDWADYRTQAAGRVVLVRSGSEAMAFKSGPSVEVRAQLFPVPLLFRAACSRSLGGLNGYGGVGWYLLTPWHAYELTFQGTWIS